ncbi:MAG TPA: Flp family type IVb pilin [Xanthobacteraceae bacterium]|nr:Flp family type IVb pilin [Xanthobacteraceae bacterium]
MSGLQSGVRLVRRFLQDQQAATAIEYGLIAAGVGMTVATTVWSLGSTLKEVWWDKLAAAMK